MLNPGCKPEQRPQSCFPPPSRQAGSGMGGGDAAELSQWLRSQHSPGCDAQDTHTRVGLQPTTSACWPIPQRKPPCTLAEQPLNTGTSSPSALMGEQVAAQAQTLVLGSSSALTR